LVALFATPWKHAVIIDHWDHLHYRMGTDRYMYRSFLLSKFINILLLIIFAPTNIFYLFYFGNIAANKQQGAI
jgi:hypothetical protein